MENRKVCPFKTINMNAWHDMNCEKQNCAWWCEWTDRCAMVTIHAEISNRAYDIMQTIRG